MFRGDATRLWRGYSLVVTVRLSRGAGLLDSNELRHECRMKPGSAWPLSSTSHHSLRTQASIDWRKQQGDWLQRAYALVGKQMNCILFHRRSNIALYIIALRSGKCSCRMSHCARIDQLSSPLKYGRQVSRSLLSARLPYSFSIFQSVKPLTVDDLKAFLNIIGPDFD